jgi:hypothetical protein
MKRILLLFCITALVLAAGCTSASSGTQGRVTTTSTTSPQFTTPHQVTTSLIAPIQTPETLTSENITITRYPSTRTATITVVMLMDTDPATQSQAYEWGSNLGVKLSVKFMQQLFFNQTALDGWLHKNTVGPTFLDGYRIENVTMQYTYNGVVRNSVIITGLKEEDIRYL